MKRILGSISLVVGVALIVATFAVFTSQGAKTNLKLSTPTAQSEVFVYTEPGVLTLVDDHVKVTLSAAHDDIQWSLAHPNDALAFIGQAPAQSIAGLESWEELKTLAHEGTPEGLQEITNGVGSQTFSLVGSDLWIEEGSDQGEVVLQFDAKDVEGLILVATTKQGKAPEVTLEWARIRDIGSPVVFYVIGSLLALIGSFLLLNDYQERQFGRAQRHTAVKLRVRNTNGASTSILESVDDGGPGSQGDRDAQRTHTGGAFGASILPASTRSDIFRNRELADEDRILLHQSPTSQHAEESSTSVDEVLPTDTFAVSDDDQEDTNRDALSSNVSLGSGEVSDHDGEASDHDGEVSDHGGEVSPNTDRALSDGEDNVSSSAQTEGSGNNWRSLWNFSWDGPREEKGDHDA
ncbi:hypothetical protein [Arcanobacterium pinnipediorum]|uniref:Uncharacterized protein n=1 Tax=Arcanobacterium pinnipediorum TaxID=1503041 RepID=A0ABY5AHR6_9ACTO|nr:hypothetical protein [Arcanobacterium pinnipediorum]USR79728.1 hypothetical protein NG665_01685 [Arcanobacterium pinnipediorum]